MARMFTTTMMTTSLLIFLGSSSASAQQEDKPASEERVVSERVISRKVVSRRVVRRSSKPPEKKSASKPTARAKDQAQLQQEAAVQDDPERVWSVRAEAITDVPLQIGGGLLLETPSRWRLKTSVGTLSRGYLAASNAVVSALDEDYPQQAGEMLGESLSGSLVWRAGVGVRPFRRLGLYGHVGYTMMRLRGETSGEALVGAIRELDEGMGEAMATYGPEEIDYASTLHMADAELGWELTPGDLLAIRLGLGWSYTLRSSSTVTARFGESSDVSQQEVAQFEQNGAITLDAVYERYFHPPTVHIGAGLRF